MDEFVYSQINFLHCADIYSRIINCFAEDLNATQVFCETVDSTDQDSLSRVLVRFLNNAGRTLTFLKTLIFAEIKTEDSLKSSILRGNSLTTKMETTFVRIIGQNFLRSLFSEILTCIIMSQEIDFEIDTAMLIPPNGTTLEEAYETNLKQLEAFSLTLLNQITDTNLLASMPREMRAIAGYTYEASRSFAPELAPQLVGGFLILRVYAPAIVSPDVYKVIPPDVAVSKKARRNLVLIAKVIQAMSNGTIGQKEKFMIPMKPIVDQYSPVMHSFLSKVASDPLIDPNAAEVYPWGDLNEQPAQPIDVYKLEVTDLFEFHRILYSCKNKFIAKTNEKVTSAPGKWVRGHGRITRNILDLLALLGPPPILDSKVETLSTNLPERRLSSAPPSLITQELENAKFLYVGQNSLCNEPVFYVIFTRIKPEFFLNLNSLATYIESVIGGIAKNGPYLLVVDMSWATHFDAMKKILYSHMMTVWKELSRPVRKNIKKVYVVHPNAFTRNFFFVAQTFVSKKTSPKIVEIYNWKSLSSVIKVNCISIPDSSKNYITKSYTIIKENAKGKKQERLLKFTRNSLLNIDHKGNVIKNETLLTDIAEIRAHPSEPVLTMFFTCEKIEKTARRGLGRFEDSKDKIVRKYICSSLQERDEVMRDIFECGMILSREPLAPQLFRVVKINQRGRRQERQQKFTIDSLLNLNGNEIRAEIPLSGIESVTLDPNDNELVLLKLKNESAPRKLVCRQAQLFINTVLERTHKYLEDEVTNEDEIYASTTLQSSNTPSRFSTGRQ